MRPLDSPTNTEVICLQIRRPIPLPQARGCQLANERLNDFGNDFVLCRENIGKIPIEAVCPDMDSNGRINKLRIDPHSACRSSSATFQKVFHAQLASNLPGVDRLALVGEG